MFKSLSLKGLKAVHEVFEPYLHHGGVVCLFFLISQEKIICNKITFMAIENQDTFFFFFFFFSFTQYFARSLFLYLIESAESNRISFRL